MDHYSSRESLEDDERELKQALRLPLLRRSKRWVALCLSRACEGHEGDNALEARPAWETTGPNVTG
jgi:hypothetical protein